jgi:hypothetical protein
MIRTRPLTTGPRRHQPNMRSRSGHSRAGNGSVICARIWSSETNTSKNTAFAATCSSARILYGRIRARCYPTHSMATYFPLIRSTLAPTKWTGTTFSTSSTRLPYDKQGVPLLNQSPFVERRHMTAAYGNRWDEFSARIKQMDPDGRMLNPFFAALLS